MNTRIFHLLAFVAILLSCNKPEEPVPDAPDPESQLLINELPVPIKSIDSYYSDEGLILELITEGQPYYIVLSDSEPGSYELVTHLYATDRHKAVFLPLDGRVRSYQGIIELKEADGLSQITFDIGYTGLIKENLIGNLYFETVSRAYLNFSEIEMVDENGAPIGNQDASDWQEREIFAGLEKAYFGHPDIFIEGDTNQVYPIYPNPFTNTFHFGYRGPKAEEIVIYFMNQNFEIIRNFWLAGTSPGFNAFAVNEELVALEKQIPKGGVIRMYYFLSFDYDGNIYSYMKGHGDVKRN